MNKAAQAIGRGGKRAGAGRKPAPAGTTRVLIRCRVARATADAIQATHREPGKALDEWCRQRGEVAP